MFDWCIDCVALVSVYEAAALATMTAGLMLENTLDAVRMISVK